MDILYLLIPVSLVIVFAIGAIFWWAISAGQFARPGNSHARGFSRF